MKTLLFDLDGTIIHGNELKPNAKKLLDYLDKNKIPFYFVTNNARRTLQESSDKLLGYDLKMVKPKHFFTSAMASALYLKKHDPKAKVALLGEGGLYEAFENDFKIVDTKADYLVVGLDIFANYDDYSNALSLICDGAKLIGTNMDRKVPAANQSFTIGNGGVIKMLEYSSNQQAIELGKPSKAYMELALHHLNVKPEDAIIVGDNLETDILAGKNVGITSVLYTQGVSKVSDIDKLDIHPDYVIDDLWDLIKIIEA